MKRPLWRILAALFALSLVAAACAGDDDDTSAGDDSGDTGDSGDSGSGGGEDVEISTVDVFPLPPVGDSGEAVLTGGTFAGAFSADEDTMAVLEYMATPEYVESRLEAGVGGFLSANQNVDLEAYSGFEQTLVEILQNAEVARFDGSDDMVAEVGAGTFWTAATDIVSGNASVEEAFGEVEADYPPVPEIDPCPAPEIGPGDGTVTIFGPEVEQEQQGFQQAFDAFTEETGIQVQIQGDRSAEEQIGVQVQGGNPPDIFIFPQPGLLRSFVEDCQLVPLPENVVSTMQENFNEGFLAGGQVGDQYYGVPNKSDVKSLVWYSPEAFEANGYEVPENHEEFVALMDQMVEDGNTPLCIGIGSDAATGWPFTDWIEDYMLRIHGPEVYDQWVNHEIPFDHPQVVEVGEFVMDIWESDGYVFGGTQAAASTPFAESGLGIIEGDCMMHRQANFYAANWPDEITVGQES
ncbi:MAG: extracellular solute-binding protein [Acidimicrobiia bacterium]